MTRRFWVVVASALVLALGPVTAPALLTGSSHAQLPTTHVKAESSPAGHAATSAEHVVLAPGSGYHSPGGSGLAGELQRRLAQAGDSPGEIDGRYGPLTEEAVRRFQARHGLLVDGIAGPETFIRLHTPGQSDHPRTAGQSHHPRATGSHHLLTRAQSHQLHKVAPSPQRRSHRGSRPITPPGMGQGSGSSSAGWLVLLGVLALGLLLIATRHARRGEHRVAPRETRSDTDEPVAAEKAVTPVSSRHRMPSSAGPTPAIVAPTAVAEPPMSQIRARRPGSGPVGSQPTVVPMSTAIQTAPSTSACYSRKMVTWRPRRRPTVAPMTGVSGRPPPI